ncbi:Lar-like restriction alleviation protein [Pseudomonas phage AF]|uniref:Lar-like restriction alleviation protein n=1 Tax=Pseudomonas phage AF TaxID=1235689 RepID=UPI000296FE83|nr:Lar-like restriction alleviation protein [Pseudomonas phage AF]AFV50642.1 putative anti-R-Lar restriction alleviation protein [Pseudomonas phage AF]
MTIPEIAPCPFCGQSAEIVDGRLVFFVRCTGCMPARCVIYGDNYQHLDHVENSEEAISAVDWDQVRQSAIDRWNRRAGHSIAGYEGTSGLYYSKLAAVANGEQAVEPVYRVKK